MLSDHSVQVTSPEPTAPQMLGSKGPVDGESGSLTTWKATHETRTTYPIVTPPCTSPMAHWTASARMARRAGSTH